MNKYLIVVFFVAALLLHGCNVTLCPWNRGYTAIKAGEKTQVPGVYLLSAQSQKMMAFEGGYDNVQESRLEIRPDGTYSITAAPDWLTSKFGDPHDKLFDKQGNWHFTCNAGGCVLELQGIQTGELLFKKNGSLHILLSIGDPNNCLGMVYEKL